MENGVGPAFIGATNVEVRKSLGLSELPIIGKNPEQLKMFQEMLMKTPVVAANDYMFGG